jgi:glucosamine-6-phosphate isomerase
MQLQIFDTYELLSAAAAELVAAAVKKKPNTVFCFASGDTPRRTYELLVEKVKEENIDFSKCTFIGLDEWLGIPPGNTGSCHYFLQTYLVQPLGLRDEQVHLFDAMADDPLAECEKMNALILSKKGIDFMLVGVGMNGHIGFNEPGTSITLNAHVITLDNTTLTVGQKYFAAEVPASKGITIGLQQVLEAGTLLMMANGKKKAAIIKQAMEEEITSHTPASLIRYHANGILMIETEAAANLEK